MSNNSSSASEHSAAAGILDLLGITPANMFDVYRILNPCYKRDRVLDAFEALALSAYTELGIEAADAVSLARVHGLTPAGKLVGKALIDLQICRKAMVPSVHPTES